MNTDTTFTRSTDADLLNRIAAGDTTARRMLRVRYGAMVGEILLARVHSREAAIALTSRVFEHIFERAAMFNSALSTPRTWIIGIAYYYAGAVPGTTSFRSTSSVRYRIAA